MRQRTFGPLAFLGFGVASAIIGLLPWLITGMRLPLQNLWATDTLPAQMPIALLPFSQYFLALTVALIVIGSAVAGIVGRAVPARTPTLALLALVAGVLLVQIVAIAQSAITVESGLSDRSASSLYLVAVTGGTIAAILLGVGLLLLIARAPRPGALIALSIVAVAFSSWLSGLVFPVGLIVSASPFSDAMSTVIRFAPAVLIGAAIAWCGVNSVGRVIAAIVSLVVLWIGPVFVTALSAAAGSRVLAPYPAEMLDYGIGVFRTAASMPELWGTPLAVAVVVAVVGLVIRRAAAKASSTEAAAVEVAETD